MRRKAFDAKREIRAIARERVGTVPAAKTLQSKKDKGPKHPKRDGDEFGGRGF